MSDDQFGLLETTIRASRKDTDPAVSAMGDLETISIHYKKMRQDAITPRYETFTLIMTKVLQYSHLLEIVGIMREIYSTYPKNE